MLEGKGIYVEFDGSWNIRRILSIYRFIQCGLVILRYIGCFLSLCQLDKGCFVSINGVKTSQVSLRVIWLRINVYWFLSRLRKQPFTMYQYANWKVSSNSTLTGRNKVPIPKITSQQLPSLRLDTLHLGKVNLIQTSEIMQSLAFRMNKRLFINSRRSEIFER